MKKIYVKKYRSNFLTFHIFFNFFRLFLWTYYNIILYILC